MFLIFSAVLNVLLDLLLIIRFKMGVAGAGYATVFSQGISAVLCLFYIYRSMPDMWPEKHHWKLHAADSRHQALDGHSDGTPVCHHRIRYNDYAGCH